MLNLGITLPKVSTGPFDFGAVADRQVDTHLPWDAWLKKYLPDYVGFEFADRHKHLWAWVESLQNKVRPRPFTAFWPRGGGKSSTAELAVVRVGFRRVRRYGWYISGTQDKADKHVETIASILEGMGRCDAKLSSRKVGKYGNSKGWRRSRVWTASDLTVDALGLDVGSRGAKVENARPDFFVIDDVDDKHDSPDVVKKKIETITTSILPAGSRDCAVLFVQNIIHPNSIAARLANLAKFDDGQEFLIDREISGPFPAVEGLTYEFRHDPELDRPRYVITGGEATWRGQDIAICQQQINDWGLSAFLQEAQHEVENLGGIWDHVEFRHCKPAEVPDLVRGCVWCDPAVTSTDASCSNGIIADGLARDGTMYRLFAWESIDTPMNVLKRAIRIAVEYRLQYVGVETNQGGDLWRDEFAAALKLVQEEMLKELGASGFGRLTWPGFRDAKAGAGTGNKVERNQRMLADYEKGKIVHVEGTHTILERALRRFPAEPLDLADAAYWGWADLAGAVSWDNLAGLGKVAGYTPRWK
jgi:cob(I)alamin adenosyltransferase